MLAYIFWKESKVINEKIDNVSSILDGEIIGDCTCKFGSGSDYIILETDTINKNAGDTIDLDNLIDARDYFLIGKDYWYQEKLNKLNNRLKSLETDPPLVNQVITVNTLIDDLSQMMVEISTMSLN